MKFIITISLHNFVVFVDYNFSHRIMHFSYGSATSGVVNPLDGEEKVTTSSMFSVYAIVLSRYPISRRDTYTSRYLGHDAICIAILVTRFFCRQGGIMLK